MSINPIRVENFREHYAAAMMKHFPDRPEAKNRDFADTVCHMIESTRGIGAAVDINGPAIKEARKVLCVKRNTIKAWNAWFESDAPCRFTFDRPDIERLEFAGGWRGEEDDDGNPVVYVDRETAVAIAGAYIMGPLFVERFNACEFGGFPMSLAGFVAVLLEA